MKFNLFGRRVSDDGTVTERLPPGQTLVKGWPVLHYGSVPRIDLETWRFHISGLVEAELSLTWTQLMALPQTTLTSDIHCVTSWSKFDNQWTGVAIRELMRWVNLKADVQHVLVQAYGGYTTNIPLVDFLADDVILAHSHADQPLTPEHGWPLRLVVPKLYFWKSAKWVRGLMFIDQEQLGFWEKLGYHEHGDPWKEERYA